MAPPTHSASRWRRSKPALATHAPYHKGNLPERLLREAARIISQEGIRALSMRRLSERLGTSRMAPYHHFESKAELLSAVGRDGFRRLGERLRTASEGQGTPRAKLESALFAYMRFALEETEFFRLMFGGQLNRPLKADKDGDLHGFAFSSPEAMQAFSALITAIDQCQEAGDISPGDPLLIANTLWAFVHGAATLVVDKHLKSSVSLEDYLSQSLELLFQGLGPGRPREKEQG
jgi:AcrR family transcriptional regulator